MEDELLKIIINQGESIKALILANSESSHLRFIYFAGTSLISTALARISHSVSASFANQPE